jgi:hypothetical protein
MSNKHLDLRPHNISPVMWWYEDSAGIAVVFDSGKGPECLPIIKWRSIRLALKRKDKK